MHLIVLDYEKYIIHMYSYVRTHDRCFILSPRLLNHIQSLFLTPSHGKNKSLVLDGLAGSLQPATWTSRYNVVEHIVTVADSILNPTNFRRHVERKWQTKIYQLSKMDQFITCQKISVARSFRPLVASTGSTFCSPVATL